MVKKNGLPIANLKCTKLNTYHKAAIVAYEFGKILGFNIYPVAIPVQVNREISFKAKNGQRNLVTITLNEECALKEWSSVFTQYYWTKSSFQSRILRKKRIVNLLKCQIPKFDQYNNGFEYYSQSRYGHPSSKDLGRGGGKLVTYRGHGNEYKQAASDFSNMMLIDAIMANNDRFPGGNIHFRPIDGLWTEEGSEIVFQQSRLFSLDNESAFRQRINYAMIDFKKYVSRFDPTLITKLKELKDKLESLETNNPLPQEFRYLEFRTKETKEPALPFILKNINTILELVHSYEVNPDCGYSSTYF